MHPRIVRAARAMLGLSQEDLARASMISATTLNLFERERIKLSKRTQQTIVRALEESGIVVIAHSREKIGIYLKAKEKTAHRAQ